jgi:hypothetical protein
MEQKTCTCCNVTKDASEFTKYIVRGKKGIRSKCKECNKDYFKQYRSNNKESISLYNTRYEQKLVVKYQPNKIKQCIKCNEKKKAKFFAKRKTSPDGTRNECLVCYNYRVANTKLSSKSEAKYYIKNSEKIKQKTSEYRKSNPSKVRKFSATRRCKKLQSIPNWLNEYHKLSIDDIYKKAHELDMHVDHIIPINSKFICGLHVPWNLQLLTQVENSKKSNKFDGTLNNDTWRECA